MENKNAIITRIYNKIQSIYYKPISVDNFDPNDYICVDHFLKILSVMYLKSDRHFNSYKPISYTEVPLGCVNSSGHGYLYIPRTDYYLSKANCYRFVECAHNALVQIAMKLKNKQNKTYIIDLRCNAGGLLMIFVACIFSFIKTRGKIGEGIDAQGNIKYEHHISDTEFYVKDSSGNKFIHIDAKPRDISNAKISNEQIYNSNTRLKADVHTRQLKSIIVNDYIPDSENYDNFSICYPRIDFTKLVVLVDHGSGSASEFMTSILKAEGAEIYGSKTIGIVTQNISFREDDVTVILPTCLFKNSAGEIFPEGIDPNQWQHGNIPVEYLPRI